MAEKFKYSNEQIANLLDDIQSGVITDMELPEDLYHAIADYLKTGLYEGFGGTIAEFEGNNLALLNELRENVYMFSAAKTFHQVQELQSCLFNEAGELRSAKEYTQLAEQTFETWNEAWGLTERQTAISQAQSAKVWDKAQSEKKSLPYLTYSTIGDACDICAPLDGLTAPVDDHIWHTVMPTNHFNCLCVVSQQDSEVIPTSEDDKEAIFKAVDSEMSDEFKMNAGIDKIVFSDKHPYFEVGEKYAEFAKNNFGLPIPDED